VGHSVNSTSSVNIPKKQPGVHREAQIFIVIMVGHSVNSTSSIKIPKKAEPGENRQVQIFILQGWTWWFKEPGPSLAGSTMEELNLTSSR